MKYIKPKYKIGDIVVLNIDVYELSADGDFTDKDAEIKFVQIKIEEAKFIVIDEEDGYGYWSYFGTHDNISATMIEEEIEEKL